MSASSYLDKYAFFGRLINDPVLEGTRMIVVIPSYNEISIIPSLKSLEECDKPNTSVEVIVVFNSSEEDDYSVREINENSRKEAIDWSKTVNKDHLRFHFISAYDLPKKVAGVGFARKIGMDEAVRRFDEIECKNGIIAGFDADSLCDKSYLKEIEQFFERESQSPGCSIYFEHPVQGKEFKKEVYEAIVQYELHLRYYNQGLRYTGHPYAYHTVGSSFAVRNESYQKQGGMNKRKAGEDFYFLQKIISLGHYQDLNTTAIFPSPRPSERVPFGTGKAVNKWLKNPEKELLTYHPQTFVDLRKFFQLLPEFYLNKENPVSLYSSIPVSVKKFLESYYFEDRLEEFDKHTKFMNSYIKRFYNWFDAFMVLKFAHFFRDQIKDMIPVNEAAKMLLNLIGEEDDFSTELSLLLEYRKIEKA